MKLEALIEKIRNKRGESAPFPDNMEGFLEDFIPNKLFKEETFQKAFEVSEQEMDGLYQEAYFLYQKKEFKKAAHVFRALIILNPFRPHYWLGLGGSLQLLKDYEKALQAYGVLVFLSPEDPAPHLHAYECYQALGIPEEAQKALEEAQSLKLAGNYH